MAFHRRPSVFTFATGRADCAEGHGAGPTSKISVNDKKENAYYNAIQWFHIFLRRMHNRAETITVF